MSKTKPDPELSRLRARVAELEAEVAQLREAKNVAVAETSRVWGIVARCAGNPASVWKTKEAA